MLVAGMSASASDDYYQDEWDAKGLIGVEVGYMGTNFQKKGAQNIDDSYNVDKLTTSSASLGLKLGGETKYYRFFVEGRIWNTNEYNNGATGGIALQYLIPLDGESLNAFIGVNGGFINVLDTDAWDPYLGADAGVNINMNPNFGIEVGLRYSGVDVADREYDKVNAFYQGYVTAIYKFTGDY